jgi:hypothetical protein
MAPHLLHIASFQPCPCLRKRLQQPRGCPSLISVTFADGDIAGLSGALPGLACLHQLRIVGNVSVMEGWAALAPALVSCKALKNLDLSGMCTSGHVGATQRRSAERAGPYTSEHRWQLL